MLSILDERELPTDVVDHDRYCVQCIYVCITCACAAKQIVVKLNKIDVIQDAIILILYMVQLLYKNRDYSGSKGVTLFSFQLASVQDILKVPDHTNWEVGENVIHSVRA